MSETAAGSWVGSLVDLPEPLLSGFNVARLGTDLENPLEIGRRLLDLTLAQVCLSELQVQRCQRFFEFGTSSLQPFGVVVDRMGSGLNGASAAGWRGDARWRFRRFPDGLTLPGQFAKEAASKMQQQQRDNADNDNADADNQHPCIQPEGERRPEARHHHLGHRDPAASCRSRGVGR